MREGRKSAILHATTCLPGMGLLKLKGGGKRNTARLNGMILIQADITYFNGVPLMTMEDDHSRNGWATNEHD